MAKCLRGPIFSTVHILLWKMVAFSALYLATSAADVGERRNISEIRYHFTPCGATGRLGPTYDQCVRNYTSISSPIIRDGVPTETYSSVFAGSQSFRPSPRVAAWNITIAGAAGGRGVCGLTRGRGIVQRLDMVQLDNGRDALVMVGQRGMDACDTNLLDHMLCTSPPQNFSSALECNKDLKEWANSLSNDQISRFTGGGAGGGASYVGTRKPFLPSFDEIVAISGGGGGSSTSLYYSFRDGFNLSTPQLYQDYVDAKETEFIYPIFRGTRGDRFLAEFVTAGSGGGYSESVFVTRGIISSDGRGMNMSDSFAEGGKHCLGNQESIPAQYRVAVGGFGGGGGGCLEGGGGGGFTGGNVVNVTDYTPGSGGHSFSNWPREFVGFNDGDGYVDIVAADCGCVYRCEVFEEEDQFQCLCPNYTTLAPDLSDCFHSVEKNVSKLNVSVKPYYTIKTIDFGNSSYILSVDAGLSVSTVSKKAVDGHGNLCVLLFIGENDEVVLFTEPMSDSGRASLLGRFHSDGSHASATYRAFLDTSTLVTGAVLASTGECTIDVVIGFNVSIRDSESQGDANFTKTLTDLNNVSSNTYRLLRDLLNLPDEEDTADGSGSNRSALSNGIVAIIVISSVLVTAGVLVAVTIPLVIRTTRHKTRKMDALHLHGEKGQNNGEVALGYVRYTDPKQASEDMQNNLGYESLDFGDNDGENETVLRRGGFVPKYEVSTNVMDFTEFNKHRANSGMNDWEYPRSSLVFLRDLGEGQFGKVMLMQAKNIAGHSGEIPVAVKTLTSRLNEVIQKFMEEIELMKKFAHPNIVSLLGVCNMSVREDSAPLMILEYLPYGDLQGFLEKYRPTEVAPVSPITERHFYNFALDVVKALEFLSSHKYVHRDIAARNCLVGANLLVKIADFGLARGVYDKDYYRVAGRTFLPIRWMAPECLMYGVFTTASDVWSFGVLLWEITSYGSVPLAEYEAQKVLEMAQNGSLTHSKPNYCPEELYGVMCQCHLLNHEERPSFSSLLSLLETSPGTQEPQKPTYTNL